MAVYDLDEFSSGIPIAGCCTLKLYLFSSFFVNAKKAFTKVPHCPPRS